MEESIGTLLELAVSQGIWAALYIYLFFRMLRENKEREERYQSTINRLSGNIESGIERIQSKLEGMADASPFREEEPTQKAQRQTSQT